MGLGVPVKHIWDGKPTTNRPSGANKRGSERRVLSVPARLAWKDQRGISRFASVVTRDVSDLGVFVECPSPLSIPLYRLVQFQVEPHLLGMHELPETLRRGRILSAVYRVAQGGQSARYGLALRLMVDPRLVMAEADAQARATA